MNQVWKTIKDNKLFVHITFRELFKYIMSHFLLQVWNSSETLCYSKSSLTCLISFFAWNNFANLYQLTSVLFVFLNLSNYFKFTQRFPRASLTRSLRTKINSRKSFKCILRFSLICTLNVGSGKRMKEKSINLFVWKGFVLIALLLLLMLSQKRFFLARKWKSRQNNFARFIF